MYELFTLLERMRRMISIARQEYSKLPAGTGAANIERTDSYIRLLCTDLDKAVGNSRVTDTNILFKATAEFFQTRREYYDATGAISRWYHAMLPQHAYDIWLFLCINTEFSPVECSSLISRRSLKVAAT